MPVSYRGNPATFPIMWRGNYIGGRFSRPRRGKELISENPGDLLDPVASVIFSTEAVDEAVAQAVKAFPRWSRLPLSKRIEKMRSFRRS